MDFIDDSKSFGHVQQKFSKHVKLFKVTSFGDDDRTALENLLNSSDISISRIETQFDRFGNYLVAVWYSSPDGGVENEL